MSDAMPYRRRDKDTWLMWVVLAVYIVAPLSYLLATLFD